MAEVIVSGNEPRTQLELYEWDNVWWDTAPNDNIKRVLYIGDSISCGTRGKITLAAQKQFVTDGFGTSKSLDNPYFKPSLKMFASQQHSREVILFNNGFHGWHLNDEEYAKYYEDMIRFLQKEFSVPVVILLTTYTTIQSWIEGTKKRNGTVLKIAQKTGCEVIDMYSAGERNAENLLEDGVHFNDKGYTELGKFVFEELVKLYPDLCLPK